MVIGPPRPRHLDASRRCFYAGEVRTTIRIDDALYRRAKVLAARTGRTVSDVIEDAVRTSLARGTSSSPSDDIPALPTFGGSGTMPGVDLGDSSRVRDLMDEGEELGALR